MKKGLLLLLLLPFVAGAQSVSGQVQKMHTVLENLYNEMIPLCSQLISVAQAIACFGATFYIGYRVWKHIANAEPIDFFPLLRPFALSIAIAMFPQVLGVINGVLKPTVTVTTAMVNNTNQDVQNLLHQRDLAAQGKGPSVLITAPGGKEEWDKYSKDDSSGGFWYNLMTLNFTQLFKLFISVLLEVLYYAAALCIDCMRTFHLVILAILGPLVFALAVFDGFQHTLSIWIARYINIYMWLPVANLFGAMLGRIQTGMLRLDISQLQQGQDGGFTQTDVAYLIFMVVGIVGYFSIPSIANYIVHASGGSALLSKTNSIISSQLNINKLFNSHSQSGGGSMSHDQPGDDRKTSSMADAANSDSYQQGKVSGK